MVRPITPSRPVANATLKDVLRDLGIKTIPPKKVERHKKWYQIKTTLSSFEFFRTVVFAPLFLAGACICTSAIPAMHLTFVSILSTILLAVGAVAFVAATALIVANFYYGQIVGSRWLNSSVEADNLKKYGAPAIVIDDARMIKHALPDTVLFLETFRFDPVLWVRRGMDERYCIAIWE